MRERIFVGEKRTHIEILRERYTVDFQRIVAVSVKTFLKPRVLRGKRIACKVFDLVAQIRVGDTFPQATEPEQNLARDVRICTEAGIREPRPTLIVVFFEAFPQSRQRPTDFGRDFVRFKKRPDGAALGAFALRDSRVGRIFRRGESRVEFFRSGYAPLLKFFPQLRRGIANRFGECVGVKAVENRVGRFAFLRLLGDIRKREQGGFVGASRRVEEEGAGTRSVLAVRSGGEFVKGKGGFRARAHECGSGFREHDFAREHGKRGGFSVGNFSGASGSAEIHRDGTERDADFTEKRGRGLRGNGEILFGGTFVGNGNFFAVGGEEFRFEAERSRHFGVPAIGDFYGEFDFVAFAEEARRVGLNHQVFRRENFIVGKCSRAQFFVVGKNA